MRTLLSLMLCLATSHALAAGIFKQVLDDGTVLYSDKASPGAVEVFLPPLQTFQAQSVPLADSDGEDGEVVPAFPGYESFSIVQPANNETLRDNGGNVAVSLAVKPELQPGHRVDIRMNGTSLGVGGSTSLSLTNVDRGTHTLHAVIQDASGKEVASTGSVVFHLHRASALNRLRLDSKASQP